MTDQTIDVEPVEVPAQDQEDQHPESLVGEEVGPEHDLDPDTFQEDCES